MDRSITIETQIEIGARPDRVWSYLVDWENLGRWMREGRRFEVMSSHREGAGVRARATIRIGGITTTDDIEVTRWEPPRVLEIDHLGMVSGRGRMECVPSPGGTQLRWKEELSPPLGVAGGIGIRLFRPLMRRIFNRDLRLLKELVESG